MVEPSQGEVWWANLPDPRGSGPEFGRPVIVVQGDYLNRSRLSTVVCVPMTSNLVWARAPGNVLLPAADTRLPRDSVALAPQILAIDRSLFDEPVAKLPPRRLAQVISGIDVVLGR